MARVIDTAWKVDLPIEVGDLVDVAPLDCEYEISDPVETGISYQPATLYYFASRKAVVRAIGGFILAFEGGPELKNNQLIDINSWIFRVRRQLGAYKECDLHYIKRHQHAHVRSYGRDKLPV